MEKSEKKSGGKRVNAGRVSKFNEITKTIAFRVPISESENIKKIIKDYLKKFAISK